MSEPPEVTVRDATVDDAAACAAIYAPYVRESVVSFETEPPDAAEMWRRMSDASVGPHRALGYEPVGVYRRAGWKDVAWFQRDLGTDTDAGDDPPSEPR